MLLADHSHPISPSEARRGYRMHCGRGKRKVEEHLWKAELGRASMKVFLYAEVLASTVVQGIWVGIRKVVALAEARHCQGRVNEWNLQ